MLVTTVFAKIGGKGYGNRERCAWEWCFLGRSSQSSKRDSEHSGKKAGASRRH